MHACAIEHRRAYLHKLQHHRSRLEKHVAGKDNAGPSASIGGTSTDFVSQNYLFNFKELHRNVSLIYGNQGFIWIVALRQCRADL